MTVLFPCIIFHKPSVRVWRGQGYPNKHHEHFKVIFSITREEIELSVKIGDKNLNLTQPIVQGVDLLASLLSLSAPSSPFPGDEVHRAGKCRQAGGGAD